MTHSYRSLDKPALIALGLAILSSDTHNMASARSRAYGKRIGFWPWDVTDGVPEYTIEVLGELRRLGYDIMKLEASDAVR